MLADCITLCRIVFSIALLFLPHDTAFAVLYILCGVSDMLDGFVARKMHTESERGAKLDSFADMVFAAVYAVRVLPLFSLSLWVYGWIVCIAAVRAMGLIAKGKRKSDLFIRHSALNKQTGLAIFLLPLCVGMNGAVYAAVFVCALATVAGVSEVSCFFYEKK